MKALLIGNGFELELQSILLDESERYNLYDFISKLFGTDVAFNNRNKILKTTTQTENLIIDICKAQNIIDENRIHYLNNLKTYIASIHKRIDNSITTIYKQLKNTFNNENVITYSKIEDASKKDDYELINKLTNYNEHFDLTEYLNTDIPILIPNNLEEKIISLLEHHIYLSKFSNIFTTNYFEIKSFTSFPKEIIFFLNQIGVIAIKDNTFPSHLSSWTHTISHSYEIEKTNKVEFFLSDKISNLYKKNINFFNKIISLLNMYNFYHKSYYDSNSGIRKRIENWSLTSEKIFSSLNLVHINNVNWREQEWLVYDGLTTSYSKEEAFNNKNKQFPQKYLSTLKNKIDIGINELEIYGWNPENDWHLFEYDIFKKSTIIFHVYKPHLETMKSLLNKIVSIKKDTKFIDSKTKETIIL